jgi:succinate dehydrogenase / fumarate reductase cytochrome b subunit
VAAVIYHALNGLRIMVVDFWPKAADRNRQLIYGTTAIFLASMAPISYIVVKPIVEKYL